MDRIIDFNELKNKASDKEIDKFEQYIYSLYYSVAQGEITMAEFSKKIMKYMGENNISQEKFFNIQKEFMKRYGFDMENLEEEMKSYGIDLNKNNLGTDYEVIRKTMGFQEKYKGRIGNSMVITYSIKNDINNLSIHLENENVLLKSEKSIDLQDNELSEFLCSYKKVVENKQLNISICEFCKSEERRVGKECR